MKINSSLFTFFLLAQGHINNIYQGFVLSHIPSKGPSFTYTVWEAGQQPHTSCQGFLGLPPKRGLAFLLYANPALAASPGGCPKAKVRPSREMKGLLPPERPGRREGVGRGGRAAAADAEGPK